MIKLNEDGSPSEKGMHIFRFKSDLGNSKVKHSKWAADPKPWTEWPIGSVKMHCSLEAHYLYVLGKTIGNNLVVNLGVGKGISCAAMAYGMRETGSKGKIIGVDLFNHISDLGKQKLDNLYKDKGLSQYVELHQGFTHEVVKEFKNHKFQFLFIDADHHYETCKMDYELWSPKVQAGGLMAFHDSDFSTVDRVIREVDPTKWSEVERIFKITTFKRT